MWTYFWLLITGTVLCLILNYLSKGKKIPLRERSWPLKVYKTFGFPQILLTECFVWKLKLPFEKKNTGLIEMPCLPFLEKWEWQPKEPAETGLDACQLLHPKHCPTHSTPGCGAHQELWSTWERSGWSIFQFLNGTKLDE